VILTLLYTLGSPCSVKAGGNTLREYPIIVAFRMSALEYPEVTALISIKKNANIASIAIAKIIIINFSLLIANILSL